MSNIHEPTPSLNYYISIDIVVILFICMIFKIFYRALKLSHLTS